MAEPVDHPNVPEVVTAPSLPAFDYTAVETIERIGVGGNADVHLAEVEFEGASHRVAIKEPRFEGTLQKQVVERFRKEAETWASLDDHDNIVSVYAWDTTPLPWIALEYMDGGALEASIGAVDIPQALWLSGRIADGLHYGHRHGVAHLDLKPSNVLLRETPGDSWKYPKISDWGLAKLLLDHSHSVEGISPAYAAPEQFDPDSFGRPDDITDIYQLGTLTYALLTGEPPFTGSSMSVMQSVMDDKPEPPAERLPDLPASANDAILTALEKDNALGK